MHAKTADSKTVERQNYAPLRRLMRGLILCPGGAEFRAEVGMFYSLITKPSKAKDRLPKRADSSKQRPMKIDIATATTAGGKNGNVV